MHVRFGDYAQRYRAANGLGNRTACCSDKKVLISHMTSYCGSERGTTGRVKMHTIPDGAFDALAAGPGNAAGVRSLVQMQLSTTRALVAAVASADSHWQDQNLKRAAADGWQLLCELDGQYSSAVADVLGHPYVHAWAIRCLRPPAHADCELDRAHIAGLAAAAAVRAKVSVRLPVPVRNGRLHLPTLGALRIDDGNKRTAIVSALAGALWADGDGVGWQRARVVSAGRLRVALEDLDPFRDCHQWPATGRTTPAQLRAWRVALSASASRLAVDRPDYATALILGLRAIVPLRRGASGNRSATARQAFGAVAIALPREPGHLDALLLHEFQHLKLHALIGMHDLFDPENNRRFKVPWRPDLRPAEGALHGTYAHLALAHLSRSRGTSSLEPYRDWVLRVTENLLEAEILTGHGRRFVAGMRSSADG